MTGKSKISEIFAAALEREPSAQAVFLQAECGEDESLLKEIQELLDEYKKAQAEDFLSASAMEIEAERFAAEEEIDGRVGQIFGRYKIIEKIGAGGMGAIYLALRTDDFQKKAAIKIIKRGMDSEAILRRFRKERQILANLEHPFIARLLDGGTTEDGLPYLVMEYVEGVPIDEYCRDRKLSENEKLEIFRDVCSAVAFAHRNLIVHRDLKPSNILITSNGESKLLDFGIAKLLYETDSNLTTQANWRALTPAYAAPEQIENKPITTAADVYSLGVILHELLTGERPNESKAKNSYSKTGDRKTTKDRKSKTENRFLKGDLKNIVAQALRREPERRYSSVEKFSDDLRRYLENLPVAARQDTFTYRATKFVRRNKIGVATAMAGLLLLAGGAAAIVWQAGEARRERALAESRFNDVRQLANSFMFEFHDAIENLPGSTPARRLVVRRALDYLNKLAQESGDDSKLQRELATAYEKIGRIQGNSYYSNLGDTTGAAESYNRSLEIRLKLAALEPENIELQNELANSFEGVGDMFYTVNDLNSGLRNYENALQIRENLVKPNEKNLAYLSSLGEIYSKIGDIKGLDGYPNLGDTMGALEAYQKATAIAERLSNAEPENQDFKYEYAQRLQNLGVMLGALGKTLEAIEEGEKASVLFSALSDGNPNNSEYQLNKLSNLIFLRWVLSEDERNDDAIEKARQAIIELEKLQKADPQNSFIKRSFGVSFNALGRSLFQSGDFRGALENHRRALDIAETLLETDKSSAEKKQDVIHALQYLADAQLAVHDYRSALANYRRADSLLEELSAGDTAADARTTDDLSICHAGIANAQAAGGDFSAALENLQKAVSLAEQAALKSPFNARIKSRMALRYFELGNFYEKTRRNEQAQNFYRKSYDIWSAMRKAGVLSRVNDRNLEKSKMKLGFASGD